ncbi:MAG: hypothetical protein HKN14_13000 [Marinicaulis sp.]|nr:hypothetical protein [Marinicaulis sp.]NNE41822.1 hypothetical protein [Marinicaulis sp.]NNL90324.1 hypothetical protein [Marinicaulis sp.]
MTSTNQQFDEELRNISAIADKNADIDELFGHAQNIIVTLQSIEYSNTLDEDPIGAAACDPIESLGEIAERLALTNSKSLSDLEKKVVVWKSLTDEETLAPDTGPVDERLLLSIVNDVEALTKHRVSTSP